jgi:UDP-glucose 4-epimerase
MTKDVAGEAFNVGTGHHISIKALAALFSDQWDYIPERKGEAAITHADITKITDMLGWQPTINLQEAIRSGNV